MTDFNSAQESGRMTDFNTEAEKVVAELRMRSAARLSLKRPSSTDKADADLDGRAAALIESQRAELAGLREQVADETRDFDGGYEAGQGDMQGKLDAAEARVTALEAALTKIAEHGSVMARLEPDAHDAIHQALSLSSTGVKNDG